MIIDGVVLVLLLMAAIQDLKMRSIYMSYTVALFSVGLLYTILIPTFQWAESLQGLIPGIVVLIIAFFTKEQIGYGDGIVLLFVGWIGGIEVCFRGMFLGLLIQSLIAIILLFQRRVHRKSQIPYLPFLFLGYVVEVFL